MAIRIPFFGALKQSSPLSGLLEHYDQIAKGMNLIDESMECYITGGSDAVCKDFSALQSEVNAVEEHADTIKRYIRNHLPRSLFLPVEKHLFFSYTRMQDDILNSGQNSLQWLAIRPMAIPEDFQRQLVFYLAEVAKSVNTLKPALENTIAWLSGNALERSEVKAHFKAVRNQHREVTSMQRQLIRNVYRSELDFKTVYQLIHFVEDLHEMSHCCEGCAELLRVMIAR